MLTVFIREIVVAVERPVMVERRFVAASSGCEDAVVDFPVLKKLFQHTDKFPNHHDVDKMDFYLYRNESSKRCFLVRFCKRFQSSRWPVDGFPIQRIIIRVQD